MANVLFSVEGQMMSTQAKVQTHVAVIPVCEQNVHTTDPVDPSHKNLRDSVRQRHATVFDVKILHVSGGRPRFEADLYQHDVNVHENVLL